LVRDYLKSSAYCVLKVELIEIWGPSKFALTIDDFCPNFLNEVPRNKIVFGPVESPGDLLESSVFTKHGWS